MSFRPNPKYLVIEYLALAFFSAAFIHPSAARAQQLSTAQAEFEQVTPERSGNDETSDSEPLNGEPLNGKPLNTEPFKVGTSELLPFVFLDEEVPYGYEIDLWNRIANELSLTVEWVAYDTFSEMMADVENGELNAAIAGISITSSREANGLDFSYPSYRSGLQLMVRATDGSIVGRLASSLFNWNLWRPLLLVMVSSSGVGALIWLLERNHNEHFADHPISGIGQGIWFAVVTLGTFGYGDVTPVRLPGRIIACLWMGVSFFIVADFIASLTVAQIADSRLTLLDLQGEAVGVIDGTTAEEFGRSQPVEIVAFEDFDQMLAALESDQLAAVIHDYPTLKYIATRQPKTWELAGETLTHEDYGIAFAEGSEEMIEVVNQEILFLQEQGYLQQLREKWLGET